MRVGLVAALVCVVGVAHAAVEDDLRDGDRYFEAGDWVRAAAAFDRAIAKAPGQVSAEAYGKRAAIFIILKNHRAGLDFIAKAKLRYPSAPEVLEQEALLLWETDQREQAIEVAERVVAARPTTFTNQQLIGEFYAARDPVKTAAAYEAYLAHRPADLEAGDVLPRVRLGFAYLASARAAIAIADEARAQGLYGKAVEQFETVQRRHGKRPNAQINADNGLCAAYTGGGRFDQAVTVCERVTQDARRIDATGSAWFNLGTAYLARKQTKKARGAALEFTKLRKSEARGSMLVGDTYFADGEWAAALDHYTRAERLVKADAQTQAQLSIRLGKTYRRLPGAGTKNLELAIEKLSTALAASPNNLELVLELGGAYLAARQDGKAAALTDKLLAGDAVVNAPAPMRANVLVLSAKALFNQGKLREARQRFEAAYQMRPGDISIRRALVLVMNTQAFEAGKDGREVLEQALAVDASSPLTLTNLAVLAIDRGDCEAARATLVKLESIRGHDVVARTRLLARSYLCGSKPDARRASEAFAVAEREAKKASAAGALAEIYTEWAPLLWDVDLAGAIDKLELAVQVSAQDPDVGPAAKRNLALALYRRGWRLLRDGKAADAAAALERATRDPAVLVGAEVQAFEFSHALALLEAGRAADAARILKVLAGKGGAAAYLRAPYAKLGAGLFAAYANARSGTLAARQQAAAELARLEGEGAKVRELLASAWEAIAYEQWRGGQIGAARTSLATAAKHAGGANPRLEHNRLALSLGRADAGALDRLLGLGGTPAESLVNLGIVYDRLGRPREAYDAWQRARARGVQSRDLVKWIEAKKRIYGF